MKLVFALQQDTGTVITKVERSLPTDQSTRVVVWLREYFGNPTIDTPPRPMTDQEIFNLWAGQMLDRLRDQVKRFEARKVIPSNGGLLD